MLKNGLFIVSLGLIAFVYSVDAVAGTYNWANLVTAVFLMAVGGVVAFKGYARNKRKDHPTGGKK